MSHFTVLVIGAKNEEEVDEILHPFWELDLSREEMVEDKRAEFNCEISVNELEKEFALWMNDEKNQEFIQKNNISYESPKEWVENYHEHYLNKEETHYGYYSNPKAKWDWFQIGGRWHGYWKLKEQAIGAGTVGTPSWTLEHKICSDPLKADIVQKRDVDWQGMKEDNIEEAEKVWKEAWKKYPDYEDEKKNKENISSRCFMYDIKEGEMREKYIERRTHFSTFAVVKDGKWYEKGEMGWFGLTANEKQQDKWDREFDKLLKSLPDEEYLCLVDCHI